jgi:hypothetical protein
MIKQAGSTMVLILSRAMITALVTLSVLLGSPDVTNAAPMTTDGIRTVLAANPNPAPAESGITGQVSIRPVRPHATLGVPNLAPYQAKLDVLDASGNTVTSFETDPSGTFRIPLPPGKYILRPQTSGPYPRASEQTVIVPPKSFAQVRIVYDSGIR